MIGKYGDMMGLALVAVLAAGLIGYGWSLKHQAKRATERAAEAEARAVMHEQASRAWEADGLNARLDLAACQMQWSDATRKAQEMAQQAAEAKRKAEADAQAWRRRWDARPQTCAAALAALDHACASIGDY